MSNNELIKLKIKKYLSQYEYLLNEYEETMYLFEKYKQEFYKDCPKKIIKNTEESEESEEPDLHKSNNDTQNSMENETYTTTNNDDENKTSLNKTLNKIYRKLCLKTHPDKDNANMYKTQFVDISEAYNKKDFLKLLLLCRELNVNIDNIYDNNDLPEDIQKINTYDTIFEKSINLVTEKIKDIKSTLAWNWACSNDEQKEQLRKRFLL